MKKYLHAKTYLLLSFAFTLLIKVQVFPQTVSIITNPGQSVRIVVGDAQYHISENIYSEPEIGATNFTTPATAINHIDFNIFTPGSPTAINNFNLYLKEVPLSTTTFTANDANVFSTAGYTLVFSGTYNANTTTWAGVDLTTSFQRSPGHNLVLLIERLDGITHAGYNFRATRGNEINATDTTSRRLNSAAAPVSGSTLFNTVSPFRPQIQFRHINPNDVAVAQVYTLGKLPIPFATPHVISVNIVNNGSNAQTNLPVSLAISGANSFSDVQTVSSIAPGGTAFVSFLAFTPVNIGINNITVSIPADDFSDDNSSSVLQEITNNAYNYAYGTVAAGSVGATASTSNPEGTGDIVAKFTTSSPTSVNQAGVNFAAGGAPFRIGVWDKSGSGTPGNLLWESSDQISTAGLFTLPINPPVPVTDTFYIGVKQIGSTNVQFSYQNEIPTRPSTFYYTNPTGNATWTDFASGNPFRFMIEPRLTIANDVGIATIGNPVANSSIDNCGIIPQATVANFGSSNQTTPFDVTFKINQAGNTVYTDTKQVALNSGETNTINFAAFTGSLTGNDSSFVYTGLTTDGARNNDTVVNKFTTGNYSYSDSTSNSGGYSFANSTLCAMPAPYRPTYNWITETTNEINWGSNGDDSILAAPITLPFAFKFFDAGVSYNQFWICTNGWISFSDPAGISAAQHIPVSIPLAGGIQNYIAGVLANLDLTTATYPDAHTYYGGDITQFIITFFHAHLAGSPDNYITFQIILKAYGDIIIQYNDTESSIPVSLAITNFCSVGIENSSGSKGILYRLNGSGGPMFGSPLAVQFYAPGYVTPVSLLNFTVQRKARSNKISWSTSQEINSRSFTIEHSADGRNFSEIGQVTGAGNSDRVNNYSFIHDTPERGINYYRLRLPDINNDVKYGPTRSVRNEGVADIALYPNPAKEGVSVIINSDKPDRGSLSITDMRGKLIYNIPLQINEGNNDIFVNTGNIAAGAYFLKVKLVDDIIVKKFNKL